MCLDKHTDVQLLIESIDLIQFLKEIRKVPLRMSSMETSNFMTKQEFEALQQKFNHSGMTLKSFPGQLLPALVAGVGLALATHPASGSWMEQTFKDSPFGSDIENSAFALPRQVLFCVMFFYRFSSD